MDSRSYVEIEHPHIAKSLTDNWKAASLMRVYLNQLLTDERGERKGFSAELFDELTFLYDLLWQIRHPDTEHTDIYMDSFRESVNPNHKSGKG